MPKVQGGDPRPHEVAVEFGDGDVIVTQSFPEGVDREYETNRANGQRRNGWHGMACECTESSCVAERKRRASWPTWDELLARPAPQSSVTGASRPRHIMAPGEE